MTTASRRAERADHDRLLGIDQPAWHCTRHHACTCPPPQPVEHCPTHGDYQPTGTDATCMACEHDAREQDRIARYDAHIDRHYTR